MPDSVPRHTVNSRYTIVNQNPILSGGQGDLYEAVDHTCERAVLIKKVRPDAAILPENLLRFEREAKITACLQHPGIVPIHDYICDEDGNACCVMEYILDDSSTERKPAKTLDDFLHEMSTLKPSRYDSDFVRVIKVLIDVCETVEFAHQQGVIHRDLKCKNILVTKDRTIVLDWGLVKAMSTQDVGSSTHESRTSLRQSEELTQIGDNVGTKGYRSPEQATNPQTVDPRIDIYSLGMIFYRMLNGSVPSSDRRNEDPLPLSSRIPIDLAAICWKATAYRPEKRYPTASELLADLESWAADRKTTVYSNWRDDLWRLTRRHQTLAASMVVLFTATLVAVGIVTTIVSKSNVELRAVNDELDRQATDNLRLAEFAESQRDELIGVVNDLFAKTSASLREFPASAAFRNQLLNDAEHHLKRVTNTLPKNKRGRILRAQATYHLALIYQQMANRKAFEKVCRDACSQFRTLSKDYPDEHTFRFDIFHCLLLQEDAAAAYDEISTLSKTHPIPDYLDGLAAVCSTLSRDVRRSGDFEKAVRLASLGCETAQELAQGFPDRPQYRRHIGSNSLVLAEAYVNLGKTEEALEAGVLATDEFNKLFDARPNDIEHFTATVNSANLVVRRAMVLRKRRTAAGYSKLAIRVAKKGIELDKYSWRRWHQLILARHHRMYYELYEESQLENEEKQFLDELEFAYRGWPENEWFRAALAQLHANSRFPEHKNIEKALGLARELDETSSATIPALGIVLLRSRQFEEAREYFSRFGRNEYCVYLALVEAHQGRFAEAASLMMEYREYDYLPSYQSIQKEIRALREASD